MDTDVYQAKTDSSTGEPPLVSYIISTYDRPDDLVEAVESVVTQSYERLELIIVGDTSPSVKTLFEDGNRFDEPWIRFCHLTEQTGVAHSRNIGFEKANGEILVQIDDDAVLAHDDATRRVVDLFNEHDDIGVLSFQSQDRDTGTVRIEETPDPPEIGMEPTEAYRAPNFVGVGAAIRREVIDRVGMYPDEFTYGFEEMDLSLRIHDAGYDILYTPSIVVYHKKSEQGRRSDIEIKEQLVENRINLTIRNLPWRYVVFTSLIWSVYLVCVTRSFGSVMRIARRIAGRWEALRDSRSVVHGSTIRRIKARQTMLYCWWYGPHPRRIVGADGDLSRLKSEI